MNVAFTVVGDPFSAWVKAQVEARNARVTAERDLMIEMDAGVAEAFAASTAVSRKYFRHLQS